MTKLFSNSRRRLLAGMVAAGFAGPGVLAQTAGARSSLPDCTARKTSTSPEALGERYQAGIYTDAQICTATVPARQALRLPGFTRGRFGTKLSAESRDGIPTMLSLQLPGVQDEARERVLAMHFTVSVNGRALPGFASPHASGEFVLFFSARSHLPPSYFTMTHDIEVGIYMPGTAQSSVPDHVLQFDKDRIAEATRLAQAEMAALRRRHAAGECEITPRALCFLTTAAVELIGLPDGCWELTTLRTFRDGWLAQQAGGPEQIAAYYERAPAIADRLRKDPRRLARLYLTHILPSAVAARLGLNRIACAFYTGMMRKVADLG